MEIEPKIVTFSWSEDDWRRVHWEMLRAGARKWIVMCLIFCTVACCLVLVNLARDGGPWPPWPRLLASLATICGEIVLIFALLMAFNCISTLRKAIRRYRCIPEKYIDWSYEMNDDGLTCRHQSDRFNTPWKYYRGVFFSRTFLMLAREEGNVDAIPRSSFSDRGTAWHRAISEKIRAATNLRTTSQ